MHENVCGKLAKFWESLTDLQMSQQQKVEHFFSAVEDGRMHAMETIWVARLRLRKGTLIDGISRDVWNKTENCSFFVAGLTEAITNLNNDPPSNDNSYKLLV